MKKMIAMLLVAVMAMSLVACAAAGDDTTTGATTTPAQTTGSSTETTGDASTETTGEEIVIELPEANAATAVLRAAWDKYAEDQKFYAVGGDYDNMVDGAAGNVPVDSGFLADKLIMPADQMANLAEAGSLLHGMNANNFTCGAFKLVEGADETAFVTAMQTAIQNNQWVCGFPELLLVMKVEGVILVAFGHSDIVPTFQTNVTNAFAGAEVLVNETIGG